MSIQERSEIDDMLEFAQRAYYDSQYSGKDLYVYGAEPQMEQMSLFGEDEASSPVSEKSDQEKAITAVLMRGSGFADGKFRIADYADENHSINDFAEMLKKEYGIGGHSGDDVNYSWTSHDGKGIQITLPRTNESEEGEKITVSWKEAAKRISKLCEQGEYITGEKAVEINSAPHSEVLMSSETKLQNKITFREVSETFGIDDKPLEVGDIVTIKDRPSEKWRVTEISSMQISFENVDENAKNRMFSHIDFGADRDNLKEKLGYIIVDDKENDRIERQSSEKAQNYQINNDLEIGGAKAKFKANIAAIETLQKIKFENRYATPEEQEIMSRYTGWGGLSEAFDSSKEKWTEEYNQLKELLTEEEYKSAKASVLDSFYTPPYIIESIYSALKNMGFDGGNILEIILPSLIQRTGIIKKCAFAV